MNRFTLAMLPLFLGCSSPWMTEGDMHWIHRAGADMPVLVRGNIDSGVFLVTLHGGPGHDGLGMALSPGMKMLEDDVAVVYWDQRASGMSQGNPSPDTFTVEDYVADTDAVLGMVMAAYDVENLFVYGHSWGGDLALATMLDGKHAPDVNAWIVSGGSDDEMATMVEGRLWAIRRAEEVIAEGTDVEWWTQALEWYDAHPVLKPSDSIHYSYVGSLRGYYWDIETYEPPPVAELAFASPFTFSIFENEQRSNRLVRALLDDFDVTDRMHEITVPVLVIAGEHDGSVPASSAEAIYDHLGTADEDKQLVIFEGVAHTPKDETPEEWFDVVTTWMEPQLN